MIVERHRQPLGRGRALDVLGEPVLDVLDTPEQAHQAYVHEHVRIHGMQSPYYEMVYAYADCIDNGAGAEKC